MLNIRNNTACKTQFLLTALSIRSEFMFYNTLFSIFASNFKISLEKRKVCLQKKLAQTLV